MIETYEVRWSPAPDETDQCVLQDMIEAETAEKAVHSTTMTASVGGVVSVYKTWRDDDGALHTGNLIRRYVPDDYGYTWVPMATTLATLGHQGYEGVTIMFPIQGNTWMGVIDPDQALSPEDEEAIARAAARIHRRFYEKWCEWREEFGESEGISGC